MSCFLKFLTTQRWSSRQVSGEKNINSSWCRPGADLRTFAGTERVSRQRTTIIPLPLVTTPYWLIRMGKGEYFVVYTSIYSRHP